MKYLTAAALAVLCAGSLAAPPPLQPARQSPPPAQQPDLRQLLQQYHDATGAVPRRLSDAERAELRRQLMEYSQPAQSRLPLVQAKDP